MASEGGIHWRRRKVFLAVVIVLTGLVLTLKTLSADNVRTISDKVNNTANYKKIDSCIAMLKNGDIVVRMGNDITSQMFCNMNTKDKTYSHCGIVLVENGYPFIYHSIGGEDNPDETLRRDSADFWMSPKHNMGCAALRFDIDSVALTRLKQKTREYYIQRKKFDIDFDMFNDDKLYCTELVYKVLAYATRDSAYILPTNSYRHTFVTVDNITSHPGAKWICRIRYK